MLSEFLSLLQQTLLFNTYLLHWLISSSKLSQKYLLINLLKLFLLLFLINNVFIHGRKNSDCIFLAYEAIKIFLFCRKAIDFLYNRTFGGIIALKNCYQESFLHPGLRFLVTCFEGFCFQFFFFVIGLKPFSCLSNFLIILVVRWMVIYLVRGEEVEGSPWTTPDHMIFLALFSSLFLCI